MLNKISNFKTITDGYTRLLGLITKMKLYIFSIITFLLYGLNCFGQSETTEKVVPWYNCPDQPENGTWRCNYSNGQLNHEYNFKNGKMDGIQRKFYSNGQLESESHYTIGQKNGSYTSWDESGNKISVTNWINGDIEGEQIYWYTSGELKRKEYYTAGQKTGIWLEWHKNGQLKSKVQYSGWTVIKDFGYWNSQGKEITNKIDRLIDSEHLLSDSLKNVYEKFNYQSKTLIKQLASQSKIDSTQQTIFYSILSERKLQIKERIESLNYEYLILTEAYNISDSTFSTFEKYCFPAEKNKKIKRGFGFENNDQIYSFYNDNWETYVSTLWDYEAFERIPPETYSFPMGCIVPPSKETKKEFEKFKEKVENEGEVIEPYYRIMTLFNGRTGQVSISIQVPEKGKRKVEERYGPF